MASFHSLIWGPLMTTKILVTSTLSQILKFRDSKIKVSHLQTSLFLQSKKSPTKTPEYKLSNLLVYSPSQKSPTGSLYYYSHEIPEVTKPFNLSRASILGRVFRLASPTVSLHFQTTSSFYSFIWMSLKFQVQRTSNERKS